MKLRVSTTVFLSSLAVIRGSGVDNPPPAFTNATVMQVEKVVNISTSEIDSHHARRGDNVQGTAFLITGSDGSLADILFNDSFATYRVMSDTLFSFSVETGRFNLSKGLMLYSVREGRKVVCETCAFKTAGNSTAIIEAFTKKGRPGETNQCGSKFILLEGSATVSLPHSREQTNLHGGQMIVQFENMPLGEVLEVDVKRLLAESRIITGFKRELPRENQVRIQQVIDRQQRELWRGTLERTPITIGGRGNERYHESIAFKTNIEAPFDPDIAGGIKASEPCPTCN